MIKKSMTSIPTALTDCNTRVTHNSGENTDIGRSLGIGLPDKANGRIRSKGYTGVLHGSDRIPVSIIFFPVR
jgi:hypothetical protein